MLTPEERGKRIRAQHQLFERLWREVYQRPRAELTADDVMAALSSNLITGRTAAQLLDRVLKERAV